MRFLVDAQRRLGQCALLPPTVTAPYAARATGAPLNSSPPGASSSAIERIWTWIKSVDETVLTRHDRTSAGISPFKDSKLGPGVGNTADADGTALKGAGSSSKDWMARLEDEDGTSRLHLGLRGAQVFFAFIGLVIWIARAVSAGSSFISGLCIFFNIEVLLHAAVLLACPLFYEKVNFLRGLARALRQVRVGLIVNGFQCMLLLVAVLASTVSSSMSGSTATKAGAAFFWFSLFAWLATLALVIISWYQIRTNPKSSGFTVPGAHFPIDHEDAFNASDIEREPGTANPYEPGSGYRPSGDWAGQERGLFDEAPKGYGGPGRREEEEDAKYKPTTGVKDPFADQGGNYGYDQAAGEHDPYDVIRKSMDAPRTPNY